MGNITEIMYSEKRSRGGYITKIDKDHFDSFKAPERPPVKFDTYIPLDPYEGDDDID